MQYFIKRELIIQNRQCGKCCDAIARRYIFHSSLCTVFMHASITFRHLLIHEQTRIEKWWYFPNGKLFCRLWIEANRIHVSIKSWRTWDFPFNFHWKKKWWIEKHVGWQQEQVNAHAMACVVCTNERANVSKRDRKVTKYKVCRIEPILHFSFSSTLEFFYLHHPFRCNQFLKRRCIAARKFRKNIELHILVHLTDIFAHSFYPFFVQYIVILNKFTWEFPLGKFIYSDFCALRK